MAIRRVIALSDLHLGGGVSTMMSRPRDLARFIEHAPTFRRSPESLELVIHGDFIDFLALDPQQTWTSDPGSAVAKLLTVTEDDRFRCVFDALRAFAGAGHEVTVIVGNHDLELALPSVQRALEERTQCRINFIDDGSAYRVGGLLIEHGNRYDPPNENDWGALRAIRSAHSRFEPSVHKLAPSVGSKLVVDVLNRFKPHYPFLDLLQPQNELLLYLLLALEPGLRTEVGALARLWRANRLAESGQGSPPTSIRRVSSAGAYGANDTTERRRIDRELEATFPDLYTALNLNMNAVTPIGAREWASALLAPRDDGLAALIKRGAIPTKEQLEKLRVIAKRALVADTSNTITSVDDPLATAARNLLRRSRGEVHTVVMGHTHLAREIRPVRLAKYYPDDWKELLELAHLHRRDAALYINTGTWADRIRLDLDRVDDDTYLLSFLNDLLLDCRPPLIAHYAEVVVSASGEVVSAQLRNVETA